MLVNLKKEQKFENLSASNATQIKFENDTDSHHYETSYTIWFYPTFEQKYLFLVRTPFPDSLIAKYFFQENPKNEEKGVSHCKTK